MRARKSTNRRKWYRNIPTGGYGFNFLGMHITRPDWKPTDRAKKLRARQTRISWGKTISVIGTIVIAIVNGETNSIKLETRLAVLETQLVYVRNDIQRLSSYWGAPPPAYRAP